MHSTNQRDQMDQTEKIDQTDQLARSPMACVPELRQLNWPGVVLLKQPFASKVWSLRRLAREGRSTKLCQERWTGQKSTGLDRQSFTCGNYESAERAVCNSSCALLCEQGSSAGEVVRQHHQLSTDILHRRPDVHRAADPLP